MAKLQFINPVEHYSKTEGLSYKLELDDAVGGSMGVIIRAKAEANPDGTFDVTLVPWSNISSFTYTMEPQPEDIEGVEVENE